MRDKNLQKLFIMSLLTLAATTSVIAETPSDNSAKNTRDESGYSITPQDQSEKKSDVRLTQKIRKEITRNDNLSTNAKNIKIMTIDGHVTLRGPVNTKAEKETVCNIARRIAGEDHVTDLVEVLNDK